MVIGKAGESKELAGEHYPASILALWEQGSEIRESDRFRVEGDARWLSARAGQSWTQGAMGGS